MPIQLFTIWMIFKQINHIKSVRDVPILLQREHISFIINLHRQENGYALDVPSQIIFLKYFFALMLVHISPVLSIGNLQVSLHLYMNLQSFSATLSIDLLPPTTIGIPTR